MRPLSFTPQYYGIKIEKNSIQVDLLPLLENHEYYDFLTTDKIVSEYNGNTSYALTIIPGKSKENELQQYGWKLKKLYFPGNWYGQVGQAVIKDSFEDELIIPTTSQMWYNKHAQEMIRQSIDTFLSFANQNFSVKYHQFIENNRFIKLTEECTFFGWKGINVSGKKITDIYKPENRYKVFKEIIENTNAYLNDYEKLKELLLKERTTRNLHFLQEIKTKLISRINKEYGEKTIEFLP